MTRSLSVRDQKKSNQSSIDRKWFYKHFFILLWGNQVNHGRTDMDIETKSNFRGAVLLWLTTVNLRLQIGTMLVSRVSHQRSKRERRGTAEAIERAETRRGRDGGTDNIITVVNNRECSAQRGHAAVTTRERVRRVGRKY